MDKAELQDEVDNWPSAQRLADKIDADILAAVERQFWEREIPCLAGVHKMGDKTGG